MTNKCNSKCQICCYDCSPNRNDVIDEELMLQAINQTKELGDIDYICFSGGEPFLYFDLLKKGLKYAKDKGFMTAVATNGYWGRWPEDERKDRIKELNVDLIRISTDEYHLQYISEKDINSAIETVRTLNLDLIVGIGETVSGKSCGEYFKTLGTYKYPLSFYTYAFERSGRAKGMPIDNFYITDKVSYSSDILSIRYDGEVFLGKNQVKNENDFSVGNIKVKSLVEILSKERI